MESVLPLEMREFDTQEEAWDAALKEGVQCITALNKRGKYQITKSGNNIAEVKEGIDGKPTITIKDPEVAMTLLRQLGADIPEDTNGDKEED